MPSKELEFLDAFPIQLSEKHSFNFLSQKELPESYAWTADQQGESYAWTADQQGQGNYPKTEVTESVPVIDLQNPNASELIWDACRNWGIFQVINHGVPLKLLGEVEGECKNLFSLPLEQKLKAERSSDNISGYGLSHFSSLFPKNLWYESFTVTAPPLQHARSLWPHNYTNFCDVIAEYQKEMRQLGEKLVWILFEGLGIHKLEDEIEWAAKEPETVLTFNSYPVCPDPDRAMGLAPHTDSTILTILHQDKSPGLQVLREGTGWLTVTPIPGALVINLGDMAAFLSNGLYNNVMHRVFPNKNADRFTFAYFYGPPGTAVVSPFSKLITPNNPQLYRSITWKEYLGIKGKLFNKTLSSIRLSAPTDELA